MVHNQITHTIFLVYGTNHNIVSDWRCFIVLIKVPQSSLENASLHRIEACSLNKVIMPVWLMIKMTLTVCIKQLIAMRNHNSQDTVLHGAL